MRTVTQINNIILQRIVKVICEWSIHSEDSDILEKYINYNMTLNKLYDMLQYDSLDQNELVMYLEGEFHIEMADDRIEDLKTVGDLVKYIFECGSQPNATVDDTLLNHSVPNKKEVEPTKTQPEPNQNPKRNLL